MAHILSEISLSLSFFLSLCLSDFDFPPFFSFQIFSFLSVTDGDDGDGAGLEQTKDM